MAGLVFIVALVAAILAVVFFLQGQSAAKAVANLREDAEAARKETDAIRAELRRVQ